MVRFLLATIIAALALGVTGFAYETMPSFFLPTIALLVVSTSALYKFLLDMKRDKPELFVYMYLGTLGIKLIAYAVYLVFMVKRQPETAVENVVFFMIGYVIFTALETVFLYRIVNRSEKH